MAHSTSAAALHTARLILKSFSLEVRPQEELPAGRIPNLRADASHLAVMVDLATNVFMLSEMRPEMRHWTQRLRAGEATAPQLATFLRRLLDAFGAVPVDAAPPPVVSFAAPAEFTGIGPRRVGLSKAAREASRVMFYFYRVAPKTGAADDPRDRTLVAKLAEAGLGLFRVMPVRDAVEGMFNKLSAGRASEKDAASFLRALGVTFCQFATYEDIREETKILVA